MTPEDALRAWLDAHPARPTPWDEGLEAQMDYAALTYDEETGRSRPLRKRRAS